MPRKVRDSHSARASAAAGTLREKRGEPRVAGEGAVRILIDDFEAVAEIDGLLVDMSSRGFRAAHEGAPLAKGQTVRFWHAGRAGRARVMWNRIAGDVTETGFLVL